MEKVEEMKNIPLLDKDDYYKDVSYVSFSHCKLFRQCEQLYADTYIFKTYEEGDKDYFTYGKLVDALLSESPEFVAENFMRVERKINIEDALKYENKIKELEAEIANKRLEITEKQSSKIADIEEKMIPLRAKIEATQDVKAMEKLSALETKKQEVIDNPDKTLVKGIAGREEEVDECKAALKVISQLADKIQVTPSIWREAEETAMAIKTHPAFVTFEWNQLTSQQLMTAEIDGIKKKGRLDHLKLSPAIHKLYAIYKANQMTKEEMQKRISELNPNDKWAIITDIKTCYSLEKLEPWSEHYMGQLSFYQDLVCDFFGLECENVKVQILAGDKQSNKFKLAELFTYPQSALTERKMPLHDTCKAIVHANNTRTYVSNKAKLGLQQTCFTCSQCRFCPFASTPGEAVLITGPRFVKNGAPVSNDESGIRGDDGQDSSGLY